MIMQEFKPKEIELKNQEHILIRQAQIEDASTQKNQ